MLFQHTWEWIVKQSPWTQSPKTMTTRRFDHQKYTLVRDPDDTSPRFTILEVRSVDGKAIWKTGNQYAVQPGRGKPALAYIRIKRMNFAPYAYDVSRDEALKEGFDTPERFHEIWVAMHGEARKYAEGIRIEFELVERQYAAHFIIDEPKAHKAVRIIRLQAYTQQHAEATAKEMAAMHGYELDKVKEVLDHE